MPDKPTEVAHMIQQAMADGTYPAGSQLPPHRTLASRYGVSPETASHAVHQLVAAGLLVVGYQGRRRTGTYVAYTKAKP